MSPKVHASRAGSSISDRLNRLPVTRAHKRIIVIIALGTFFEIYELFLSGVLATTLSSEFRLGGAGLSLVLASPFLGAFLGAVVIGPVADRLGRRKAYMITLALYSAATLAAAFSSDLWMLVACRFIAGVGLGGELPVTDSFLGEILPAKRRGYFAAWAFTVAYTAVPVVGFLGLGMTAAAPWGIAGWRWMFAFGAAGAIITFLVRRQLPESPRWLQTVGRAAEAEEVTHRLEEASRSEGWDGAEALEPADSTLPHATPLPASALLRRPLVQRTVLMALVWILAVIGYHGFSSVATLALTERGFTVTSSLLYTSLAFIGYPVGSAVSMWLMERMERKLLLGGSLALMAVLGIVFGNAQDPTVIVVFGFCFTVVANVMSNATHVYQLEQFPTGIRTTATGWLYSLGRLSTAVAPFYLVPLLQHAGSGAVFTLVGAACLVAALAVVVAGVRTTGLSVEEISPELRS
ncbi:MFS transporter [Arthrobacter sp. STN4]|uniref:MFS transporter n=1 Tax=Arthrobacter sp. STN4 TaxID=2923276 RepID=UPI00211A2088|nr:MFS transporter [Arthrobacter sp. STN4]MCQ9163995.1 MFS transporter [Arthrobacter sp. STN4]